MDILQTLAVIPLEFFARAGGGGSGGSSSSGGGGSILFLIGYIPMHFIGAVLRRAFTKGELATIVANIVGWIIASIYAAFWFFTGGYGFLIGLCALVGMAAGLYNLFSKLRQSNQVKDELSMAAVADPAWNEAKLTEYASSVFIKYQEDWSNLNAQSIKTYATPHYFYHASLLIYILQSMGRRDIVSDIRVTSALIVSMYDASDDNQDTFTIGFTAAAHDELTEVADGTSLFTDNSTFTEYWTFVRHDETWLLDGIAQATMDPGSLSGQLRAFATQQGYCYSEDMGWLFIPKRGQLFDGSKFGTSDINNHIVGLYNNQLLVQLYSYVKNPKANQKVYVIAQVNVPKQYGNIVVRRKKAFRLGISGLQRVETEWTQFNKKYEVFASSYEQATSFELLNPTYMEQLEVLPFEVNIEVVDNVIYLYAEESITSVDIYTTMLDLLNSAFKELRL